MSRPRGRPPMKESERRSHQMAIRFTKSLRKQLEQSSRHNGTTLTEEIEGRLRRSFDLDEGISKRFGRDGVYAFLRLISEGILEVERACQGNDGEPRRWLEDRFTFDQVVSMIKHLLKGLKPDGDMVIPDTYLERDPFTIGRSTASSLVHNLDSVVRLPDFMRDMLEESTYKILVNAAIPLLGRFRKSGAVERFGVSKGSR
jgi:hypothetical protein